MMLISGTRSGLGRYLHENLGGVELTRSTTAEELEAVKKSGADVIIHCAFNSAKTVDSGLMPAYLRDNVLFTRELASIRHRKFIFISSIDVYPRTEGVRLEDDVISPDYSKGMYGVTKLMSEAIVASSCKNFLIIRAGALLGKYSRKNSLTRILDEKGCVLSLDAGSKFYYVLHSEILRFIESAVEKDIQGIYNAVPGAPVTLSEIALMAGNDVRFGGYRYDPGEISNKKITKIFPAFENTSMDAVMRFLKEREDEEKSPCMR